MTVEDYTELNSLLENQSGSDLFQVKYHLETYLNSLQLRTRRQVLVASILSEFNLELCEFISSDSKPPEILDPEEDFIDKLASDGMFIIPLDSSSKWFRYHHYFRDLLLEDLNKEFSGKEIHSMHASASVWFESNELFEKAIRHAIMADAEERALELFTRYRIRLLSNRNWKVHEAILDLFSEKCQESSPVMLISRAWVNIYHGKMTEAFELISSISEDLNRDTGSLLRC